MRSKFAMLLGIAAVCVTTAWAGWTSESLVNGSQMWREFGRNNAHKVVYGTDGVGHLVWSGGPPTQDFAGVWYNRYNPGSGSRPGYWGADFAIAPLKTKPKVVSSANPGIALDGDGRTIHVVYKSRVMSSFPDYPDSVCYRKCTQDRYGKDKWGAAVNLYAAKYIYPPAVACAPNEPNHVYVCWRHSVPIDSSHNSMVTRFREYVNGAWTAVVLLDSADRSEGFASIAAAPNGDVFVAYPGYDDGTSGLQIFVKTRHNGVWGDPVNVTKSFSSILCTYYTIEVNPITRNPHVVFERKTEVPNGEGLDTVCAVYHTFRNAAGDWLTTPDVISEPHYARLQLHAPTMTFVSTGAAYVAWYDTVPPASCGNMYSYCSSEGGTWSTPEWLTSYSSRGSFLAVEEARSAVHLFWDRHVGDYHDQIWWKSDYLGGGGSQAEPMALSQSSMELYPNPVKAGRVTVKYSLPLAGPLTVALLDVTGRTVKSQAVVAGEKGSFALDVRGLRAGVYILKLDVGSDCLTRKLVIH